MRMDEEVEEGRWMKMEDGRLTRLYMCKPILSGRNYIRLRGRMSIAPNLIAE